MNMENDINTWKKQFKIMGYKTDDESFVAEYEHFIQKGVYRYFLLLKKVQILLATKTNNKHNTILDFESINQLYKLDIVVRRLIINEIQHIEVSMKAIVTNAVAKWMNANNIKTTLYDSVSMLFKELLLKTPIKKSSAQFTMTMISNMSFLLKGIKQFKLDGNTPQIHQCFNQFKLGELLTFIKLFRKSNIIPEINEILKKNCTDIPKHYDTFVNIRNAAMHHEVISVFNSGEDILTNFLDHISVFNDKISESSIKSIKENWSEKLVKNNNFDCLPAEIVEKIYGFSQKK